MLRSLLLVPFLLVVSVSANAESWKTDSVLNKERSAGSCRPGGTYTLDLTGSVFTATNAAGKMFSITLPADGAVKHAFKSSTGASLEIVGNAKARDLEIINSAYGCRWKMVPK
ncbi:MAG: hypothetical protein Q8L22_17680 [Reyranella sp.]|nr:hypothetical protein [Reyranella sp.]